METKANISKWFLIACTVVSLTGCEDPLIPNVTNVLEYAQSRNFVNVPKNQTSDLTNVYFDFSCINYATDMYYREDPNADQKKKKNYNMFDALLGHITSGINNYQFYKVDDRGTSKIHNEGTSALYNAIKTAPTNEKTKIDSALDLIVKSGNPAIYITDYEGYDGDKFDESAFASKYFADWLKAGNKITFIATDYEEKMRTAVVSKWMYITVFDYANGVLTDRVMQSISSIPSYEYKVFRMSNSFSVKTKYENVLKGGDYHDKSGNPLVCGTNEDGKEMGFKSYEDFNADFYPFSVSWEAMKKTSEDLAQYGDPRYRNFLSGLYINQKDLVDCYNIKSFSLKVENVQADFDAYYEQVEDSEGKLMEKHGNATIPSVSDLFEVDKYKYNSYSEESEIAINFSQKYVGGTPIGMNTDNDFLCVRLFVDDVDVKFNNNIFRRSDGNNALEKSVREALNHAKPTGKLVYTYFMRVL